MKAANVKSGLAELEQVEMDAYDALQMALITEQLVGASFGPIPGGVFVRTTKDELRMLTFAIEQVRRQIEAIQDHLKYHIEQAQPERNYVTDPDDAEGADDASSS